MHGEPQAVHAWGPETNGNSQDVRRTRSWVRRLQPSGEGSSDRKAAVGRLFCSKDREGGRDIGQQKKEFIMNDFVAVMLLSLREFGGNLHDK
jgi:hypothetical protein